MVLRVSAPQSPKSILDSLLGYQLRRASSVMMASLSSDLGEFGLTTVEASVLLVIGEQPGISQSEIGRVLDIHRANMAPIAAKLASLELTTSQRAGRAFALSLTPHGKRNVAAIRQAMLSHEARFLPELSSEQRAQLLTWIEGVWKSY